MIVIILILGFILRLINLNQSLWLDEAIEAMAVKTYSVVDLITKYSIGDFHGPFYHVVLKFWTDIFGYGEVSLRLPSVIFGTATIFVIYKICQNLFSFKISYLSSLFLAVNPLAIYYSQENRMYSLAMFLVTLAVYLLLRRKMVLFSIVYALALYTDYLPIFIWPLFVYLVYKKKINYIWLFIPGIIFVPWVPYLLKQLNVGTSVANSFPEWRNVVGGFSYKNLPLTLVKFIIGRISFDNKILYVLIFGSISCVYLWILSKARNIILWLWLLIPLFFASAVSLFLPVYSFFRFLFVVPAFVSLLALGSAQRKSLVVIIFIISLLSIGYFNLNPIFQREDWKNAVKYISNDRGIVLMPSLAQNSPLLYYGDSLDIMDIHSQKQIGTQTVYLVRYVQEIFDPNDLLRKNLESSGYVKTEEKSFNGVLVWKYIL